MTFVPLKINFISSWKKFNNYSLLEFFEMLESNDEELYKLAREYHDHGHMNNPNLPRGRDTHRIHGFNFRMTEIQAVIAKAQLKKINM